jgi:hypothetical protein
MQTAAVIVRGPTGHSFVRAENAQRIVAEPTISRVPNTEIAMALVAGRVVSVLELGASTGALLLCELDGEPVGFSGLVIERVGLFDVSTEGARVGDATLPELLLADVLERALGAETDAAHPLE